MSSGWFGKSWGAHGCVPSEHVRTPVGSSCLRCGELILEGHQGVVSPCVHGDGRCTIEPTHLECWMDQYRPHGVECPHCRGHDRSAHGLDCKTREGGALCTCTLSPFSEAAGGRDGSLPLSEALTSPSVASEDP